MKYWKKFVMNAYDMDEIETNENDVENVENGWWINSEGNQAERIS